MPTDNSIGDFTFLELLGPGVDIPKEMVQLIQRPGVAGSSLKLLGVKGQPFVLRSRCDALDLADAQTAFANYCTLIGSGSYPLVFRGIEIIDVNFAVLNVTPAAILQRFGDFVGGLFSPSLGWIEADWTLLPIEDEE